MLMVTYIKVIGKTEKQMDMEYLLILMEACTKEIGLMINSMVMEQNLGIIRKSNILEIFRMERKQVMEDLNLKVAIMKEIFWTENSMAKEFTIFLIQAKFMKEILKKIIWTNTPNLIN